MHVRDDSAREEKEKQERDRGSVYEEAIMSSLSELTELPELTHTYAAPLPFASLSLAQRNSNRLARIGAGIMLGSGLDGTWR